MLLNDDPYDLNRFLRAQGPIIEGVLDELANGKKQGHWMWFIFPQMDGLGYSEQTKYYSIKSAEEARKYLDHPVLGPRLMKCAEAVIKIEGKSAEEIFGWPDHLKLKSSMTLFASISVQESVFARVLDKFFEGRWDKSTLDLLETH